MITIVITTTIIVITTTIIVITTATTVITTATRWGKKVWFTEFARPTTRDPAMELEYMQVIIVIAMIAMIIIMFYYILCEFESTLARPLHHYSMVFMVKVWMIAVVRLKTG